MRGTLRDPVMKRSIPRRRRTCRLRVDGIDWRGEVSKRLLVNIPLFEGRVAVSSAITVVSHASVT